MRLRSAPLTSEDGLSLFIAVGVLFVSSLLVAATLVAARGDIHATQKNTDQKTAYFAALAGIEAYQYHLNAEPDYWSTCKGITEAHVEASGGATYTVKVLPSTRATKCEPGVVSSVIQSTSSVSGNTFRVESTGEVKSAGKTSEKRSVIATFGNPSFLDYVYVSNYETEDPVTYPETEPHVHCENYHDVLVERHWTGECEPIEFRTGDKVNGPMHTNDAAAICGSPSFGRTGFDDQIEMNGGYYEPENCGAGLHPVFNGSYTTDGPTLLPPSSDSQLASLAGSGYKFAGETTIKLNGSVTPNKITVTNAQINGGQPYEEPFPSNGVIYVEGSGPCTPYTPFNTKYEDESDCGTVYVEKSSYTESLTIAALDDVVIKGSITTTSEPSGKPTGSATLGLIASNFVRIYHPVTETCGHTTCKNESTGECNAENATGSLEDPVIDAAILTTDHSFIVDNYKCGHQLGNLTVWGAIAQNWRGPVGTTTDSGETGYLKSYNYDERLASDPPPDFLTPSATVWRVERKTVD